MSAILDIPPATKNGVDNSWEHRMANLLSVHIHGSATARANVHDELMTMAREVDSLRAKFTMGERKAVEQLASGWTRHGKMVRREDQIMLITDLGRCEVFPANEHGGIQQPVVEEDPATADEIHRARDQYALGSSDNIEVDDNARVSRGDDGCFVQGWLWLPNEKGNGLCEMHEWTHHEAIRRHYKKANRNFTVIDSELVGNISYYLVYASSWPKQMEFHYMSAHPDFSFARASLAEVDEPFKQWFIDAMNRYSEKA